MLAALRPNDLDFPLLLHVGAATILVGSLMTALVMAGSGSHSRLTFRALLWAAVPAWIVMNVAAEWLVDKEGLDDDPTWIGIGYMAADIGALAIIAATIIAGVSARRGNTTSRWVTGLTAFTIILALVAIWAMTTKPT
jgi:hypothetical protein